MHAFHQCLFFQWSQNRFNTVWADLKVWEDHGPFAERNLTYVHVKIGLLIAERLSQFHHRPLKCLIKYPKRGHPYSFRKILYNKCVLHHRFLWSAAFIIYRNLLTPLVPQTPSLSEWISFTCDQIWMKTGKGPSIDSRSIRQGEQKCPNVSTQKNALRFLWLVSRSQIRPYLV